MKVSIKISIMALAVLLITGIVMYGAPIPIFLGTAGNFVVLSKAGITCAPNSVIIGDMGVSPIAASAITGFGLLLDTSGTFSTSAQVRGKVYAANYFSPTPTMLTMAVNDMLTAYVDAAGRTNPDYIEQGTGNISGRTLAPGLYKLNSGISMTSDVTLNGGPNDVWIFQCAGFLSMSPGVRIRLAGGAQARNVFWQTFSCNLGASTHLEGTVLSATTITLGAGATVTGRLLAQTAVNLQMNTVTQP